MIFNIVLLLQLDHYCYVIFFFLYTPDRLARPAFPPARGDPFNNKQYATSLNERK